jgi:hypothetical protein
LILKNNIVSPTPSIPYSCNKQNRGSTLCHLMKPNIDIKFREKIIITPHIQAEPKLYRVRAIT